MKHFKVQKNCFSQCKYRFSHFSKNQITVEKRSFIFSFFSVYHSFSFCLSFLTHPNQLQFTICMPACHFQAETGQRGRQSERVQGVWCRLEKMLCAVLHLLPGLDTAVCQKTKGESFQGYHQTGEARDEITQRRKEDETLLITPPSLYFSKEVAECIPNCS